MGNPILSQRSETVNTILFLIISATLVITLFQLSTYSYLLFHSLIELFAIVIACAVFVIGWNSKGDNKFFLFIGIAYLFVAGIDILHTLSYYGTGIFPGYDADLPTQLWIAGRYLESASLLLAPIFYKIGLKLRKHYIVLGYFVVTSILVTATLTGVFPSCFIMGEGLTLFKVASEYVISGILILAALAYYKTRENFDEIALKWFFVAIAFSIAAEMSFTLYTDVYGFSNMIGHYLRFISYYMVYKAVIEVTLTRPYDSMFKSLKESEESLLEANEFLQLTTKVIRHDIRNELSRISLAIELHQQSGCREDLMEEVFESIDRCTLLVESTHQISLAYEGKTELIRIDIREVLLQASGDTKLNVTVEGEGVVLAGTGLLSVFRNIIMNAEKHSSSDRIEIIVSKIGNMVETRISDFGTGITEEVREKIFEEGFSSGTQSGSGLGMFIAKKLVESYKGTIHVEPNQPTGATFVVKLPASNKG